MAKIISPIRRYPAVGCCIYCGSTSGPFGDEHIVPYALGGRLLLPDASCKACEKITCRIETVCTRHLMGNFRRRIGMPSRNRSRQPAVTTLDVVHEDESIERKTIAADEFPRVLMLPKFSVPEILSGQKAEAPEAWIHYNVDDVDRAKEHGGKGFTVARYDLSMFCRMLAKIAHAYTIAECGPAGFAPASGLLPELILKGGSNPYALVGGDQSFVPGAEAFMYRLGCFHHATVDKNYLCVFLRLYAFIDESPLYQIAVADITNPAHAPPTDVPS